MRAGELFDPRECRQPLVDKPSVCHNLARDAHMGIRFMYTMREAAGLLHISYDEIQGLIQAYQLDAIRIATCVRIPWWSIAEYLLDNDDDIEGCLYQYIDSLPRRKKAS